MKHLMYYVCSGIELFGSAPARYVKYNYTITKLRAHFREF